MSLSTRVLHGATLTIVIMALGGSCVRLDEEHCILNGGDFACDADSMCVTDLDGRSDVSDEGDGCVQMSGSDHRLEDFFVHVQYGLPSRLAAHEGDAADDLQSVTGVLVRAARERGVEGVCVPDEGLVRTFEAQWREVDEIRRFLDRATRVRAASAALGPEQVEVINEFTAAINDWLNGCEILAGGG